MPDAEHDESTWTVRDDDGIVHRAMPQTPGHPLFVITACDWWKYHNVSGEKAPVRYDEHPTCFQCVTIDLTVLQNGHCKHCGVPARQHANTMSHTYEAA